MAKKDPGQINPGRAASWWSRVDDLLWPDPRITDRVERRADALAEAEVETVLHFGFHERFDFAPYFSLIHGLLLDIAEALHQRGIRFIDHYSCNIVARPRGKQELLKYHSDNRHHVSLHPGPKEAAAMGYDGIHFNDLREIDIGSGEAAYTPYQSEAFCHNNPAFLRMHEGYLRRQFEETPLDGIMADDMRLYAYFRSCGCEHCRDRFRREYGHELPPLEDASFWGDTSGAPTQWGNYDNPAFRDWVHLRYRTTGDHLRMVKRTIGEDKILLTCCSQSGPKVLNSLGLSYESFIDACDWVLMENCGLAADTVRWQEKEPEALLHKSVAWIPGNKAAPALAISYFVYPDGAYLGWALARFWGVSNWASTLLQGPFPDEAAGREESELLLPYNRWEKANCPADPGTDAVDAAVVFARATRDNGWTNGDGEEHWQRVREWAGELGKHSIGYRFVLSRELETEGALRELEVPLILDSCACLSDTECESIIDFVGGGGTAVVAGPLGTHTERGVARGQSGEVSLEQRLRSSQAPQVVWMGDDFITSEVVTRLVSDGAIVPRILARGPQGWAVRLRFHDGKPSLHLLNRYLEGVEHPDIVGRPSTTRVLRSVEAYTSDEPLLVTIDFRGLDPSAWNKAELVSPEIEESRPVGVTVNQDTSAELALDLGGLRIYAMVRTW